MPSASERRGRRILLETCRKICGDAPSSGLFASPEDFADRLWERAEARLIGMAGAAAGSPDAPGGAPEDVPGGADDALSAAIDALLERCGLSVREDADSGVVNPASLADIIECFRSGGLRRRGGAFYTPRPMVVRMCRQALAGHLEAALAAKGLDVAAAALDALIGMEESCGGAPDSVVPLAGELDAILARTTVCDPAAGSGALLAGMLREMARLRRILAAAAGRPAPPDVEAVLLRRLCGVEMEARAARAAILRLRLLAAAPPGSVLPPEGDIRIRVGDALELSWEEAFPDVFAAGGFDIVIANPPYVRQELLRAVKPRLREIFGAFFCATADLHTYFHALALRRLCRPGGHCCLIAPNKFFRAAYGRNLRMLLTSREARILRVEDFGGLSVFADADPDAAVILARREPTPADGVVRASRMEGGDAEIVVPTCRLSPDGWILEDGRVLDLLEKIRSIGRPLKEVADGVIRNGVKTGCNEAFVIDDAARRGLIAEDPACAELIRPWLRGRDLRRWRTPAPSMHVLLMRRGTDIGRHPGVERRLSAFRERLEPRPPDWEATHPGVPWPGRGPGAHQWHELQISPGDLAAFEAPKLVWPDIALHFRGSYDEIGCFCGNTAYFLPTRRLFLPAICCGRLMDWFIRLTFQFLGDPWRGGRARLFAAHMENLPVAVPEGVLDDALRRRTRAILDAKDADMDADVAAWEAEIDGMILDLYGLTAEERELVLRMTERARRRKDRRRRGRGAS